VVQLPDAELVVTLKPAELGLWFLPVLASVQPPLPPLQPDNWLATIASLQASLRGRRRGNCHPGELGAALRRLGFVLRRNWRGERGFLAVWRKTSP
jgi:hypothetical protein